MGPMGNRACHLRVSGHHLDSMCWGGSAPLSFSRWKVPDVDSELHRRDTFLPEATTGLGWAEREGALKKPEGEKGAMFKEDCHPQPRCGL